MMLRLVTTLLLVACSNHAAAYTAEDFAWFSPVLLKKEFPAVTIVLDNSESMLSRAHSGPFIPGKAYAGCFDPTTYYVYGQREHGPAFVPDNSTASWNGSFLNWATMTRLDIARMALTGGKYDSEAGCLEADGPDLAAQELRYDDSVPVADTAGRIRFMTPFRRPLALSSIPGQNAVNIRAVDADGPDDPFILHISATARPGVLQAFRGKARMALFVFNGEHGGRLIRPMDGSAENIQSLVEAVNTVAVHPGSPLAETLHTVYGYLRQDPTVSPAAGPRYAPGEQSYNPGNATDPFRIPESGQAAPCSRQSVILISDGGSTRDHGLPPNIRGLAPHTSPVPGYDLGEAGSAYIIDIAYAGRTSDLRPGADLPGEQNWSIYTVMVADRENPLLMDAAKFGNFRDMNGNYQPDLREEYDLDGDGIPDGYFQSETGLGLGAALTRAFQLATAPEVSGTVVASHPRLLEAQTAENPYILYQAVSFPPFSSPDQPPPWSGQIHAYFVDAHGNLHEDTDDDGVLDPEKDRIIQSDGDTIRAHADTDGNGAVDEGEITTVLDSVQDIRFPWSTSVWLNALTDGEAGAQRQEYASPARARYIFTFVDENGNMLPDTGEIQPFDLPEPPSQLGSPAQFHNYLTLYESRPGVTGLDLSRPAQRIMESLRRTDPDGFRHFLAACAKRQVDFIRGVETGNATIGGIPDNTRSRRYSGGTWRLGDIANSAPVLVGAPAENYHLVYGDKSYESFLQHYAKRRRVVYAGANDGMLHAFNAGFAEGAAFATRYDARPPFPLGMELWAYIPFNLLPHLKWLTRPDYGERLHAAYMDLKPRVFDARIFFASDGITPCDNATHPGGWGTILVAGMRMGGASIMTDIDKADGDSPHPGRDRALSSAYVIMDITDPERPPRLIAEITLPGQGFTTCRPAVIAMSTPSAVSAKGNRWHLVFGSGPASADGSADAAKLSDAVSNQPGRLYILDLNALISERNVKTLDAGTSSSSSKAFATLEADSFVSSPIAVDLDLPPSSGARKTDAVYFGTVSGPQAQPGGRLWKLSTDNADARHWRISTLFDPGQPVSAAPTASVDDENRLWLHFGTGRLFDRHDIAASTASGFYSIKDRTLGASPDAGQANGSPSFEDAQANDISVATNSEPNSTLAPLAGPEAGLREIPGTGWKRIFQREGERVLEQAVALCGRVYFTSYTPDRSICTQQGSTRLWSVEASTGDARLLSPTTDGQDKHGLPPGREISTELPSPPKREGRNALFHQEGSTIKSVDTDVPLTFKSTLKFWRKNTR